MFEPFIRANGLGSFYFLLFSHYYTRGESVYVVRIRNSCIRKLFNQGDYISWVSGAICLSHLLVDYESVMEN